MGIPNGYEPGCQEAHGRLEIVPEWALVITAVAPEDYGHGQRRTGVGNDPGEGGKESSIGLPHPALDPVSNDSAARSTGDHEYRLNIHATRKVRLRNGPVHNANAAGRHASYVGTAAIKKRSHKAGPLQ